MLDIHARISGGGEQGLLGIALHPGFPTDPRIFVDYTDTNGDTVVSSYRLDPADPDRLVPASQTVILTVDQPFENHNGGALQFGPDGDLYISLGDGGDAGDPFGNGQNTDTLLGKILRIDIDHPAGSKAYSVPADNPFVGKVGYRPEIWLYGLRNPWRMSFDRATGDLWIGDVGQDLWEEVDVIRAGQKGLDLGWNIREATHCFRPVEGCASEGLTPPVAEYGHGQGCTVIGGYVYRGTAQPGLTGLYLAADYCSGILWAIPATAESLVKPQVAGFVVTAMVAFAEDAAGELYLLNEAGDIYRVTAAAP
jgi:glucose/arabinose dehydrogenase